MAAIATIATITAAVSLGFSAPIVNAQTPTATTPAAQSAPATVAPATTPRAKVVALVSAVGDQFQYVRQKESVGSHLDPYVRQTLNVPDHVLNYAVLRGLDRAVALEQPGSTRVLLAMKPDMTIALALPQDREALSMQRVLQVLEAMPARAEWDEIIVVTPKWLMSERQGMGSKLSGIGLYVQPLGPLVEGIDDSGLLPDAVEDTDREQTRSRRYVAPFFYVQVSTLDAKTLKVLRTESRHDFRKIVNRESAALDVQAAFTPEQLAAHVERFVETSALRAITQQGGSVEIGRVRTVPAEPEAPSKNEKK